MLEKFGFGGKQETPEEQFTKKLEGVMSVLTMHHMFAATGKPEIPDFKVVNAFNEAGAILDDTKARLSKEERYSLEIVMESAGVQYHLEGRVKPEYMKYAAEKGTESK
jgi:hypothetical protein